MPLTPTTCAADPMTERDLVGYGAHLPDPHWPGGAKIAVNFSLNVEGGGEATLYNGDDRSEGMLNDIGVPTRMGRRDPLVESVFEYGSRRGAWRVLDIFGRFDVPMSILAVGRAAEQNPDLIRAFHASATRSSAMAGAGSNSTGWTRKPSGSISAAPSRH